MKKLATFAVLPALGLLLSPGDVSAGATASAGACFASSETTVFRATNGLTNLLSGAQGVTCQIPVDHQLGGTVTFRIRMVDLNSDSADDANVLCIGTVRDQDGNGLGDTPIMASGTGTFTGFVTKTASVTVSPQSASHTYAVTCLLPGGGSSGISTVRVF
ncbi:hypothetical protein BE21_35565 [Sorangium cellulosum]|uniref:Secreted protein n=1 Tax=Sorangium cellulosum TaxID=56 RepID=A0A150TNS4_SORCE|nr:hypothetical protein BE21_35565 [Sorangium cellulosum]